MQNVLQYEIVYDDLTEDEKKVTRQDGIYSVTGVKMVLRRQEKIKWQSLARLKPTSLTGGTSLAQMTLQSRLSRLRVFGVLNTETQILEK